ncbi:helix-turn-helix domain-containing protein [Arthrobacter sp.]|uniref:helix-turn-helix domain-containing protein n=1 Tax=Arthrobacter sp. TaxID=1667 RepID=UPI003A8E6FBA
MERAADARAVASSKGKGIGRLGVVHPSKLAYAKHLSDQGNPIREGVEKTDITRSSLYRYLPPRLPRGR